MPQGTTTEVWLYQDGIEYRDDEKQSIYHEEGRVVYDEPLPIGSSTAEVTYPEWFLKDHPSPGSGHGLGNVRARIVDKDESGDIQVDMEDDGINEITGSYHYYHVAAPESRSNAGWRSARTDPGRNGRDPFGMLSAYLRSKSDAKSRPRRASGEFEAVSTASKITSTGIVITGRSLMMNRGGMLMAPDTMIR